MTNNSPRVMADPLQVSVPTRRDGDPQVRLSLSLSPVVAGVLKDYAHRNGITITEAVRRAASILGLVDTVEQEPEATLAVKRGNNVQPVSFNWDR